MTIIALADIQEADKGRVGGKAWSLSRIAKGDFTVPTGLVVTTRAYRALVIETGLDERIMLELSRKDFKDMRWEEMWDASQRIRSMFARTPMPKALEKELTQPLATAFADAPVAVRSSAPGEDEGATSFAGLHESYVNVRGAAAILDRVKLVWASLWSDAALLYRQHTGLRPETSSMAVLIQELVQGSPSGVAFTRSPVKEGQCVVEAVHGLNQGLVDGSIAPDRYVFDRRNMALVQHVPAQRSAWIVAGDQDTVRQDLPKDLVATPPLSPEQARRVMDVALQLESLFQAPQDVEWTLAGNDLTILQSRPITTLPDDAAERQRRWYLSLRRSLPDLEHLADRIENHLIPAMIDEAGRMESISLDRLEPEALAGEIGRRAERAAHWHEVYWDEFIPFAHGMRLFGQFYNDTLQPHDPYEFMNLLAGSGLQSMQRNSRLVDLAQSVSLSKGLREKLAKRDLDTLPPSFQRELQDFVSTYGDLSCADTDSRNCTLRDSPLPGLLLEMAELDPAQYSGPAAAGRDSSLTRDNFLAHFTGKDRDKAERLLDLGRKSYRLRDDDNIHLGRLQAQLANAVQRARDLLAQGSLSARERKTLADLVDRHGRNETPDAEIPARQSGLIKVGMRQLRGQPGGPGLAQGRARVIVAQADLGDFKKGEVLVCDALDPNMTFVVPLAAAIVERRGGMLIHGAIIAREYGLPCVTGIPDATRLIQTGDHLTVDGYLGIVTLRRKKS